LTETVTTLMVLIVSKKIGFGVGDFRVWLHSRDPVSVTLFKLGSPASGHLVAWLTTSAG